MCESKGRHMAWRSEWLRINFVQSGIFYVHPKSRYTRCLLWKKWGSIELTKRQSAVFFILPTEDLREYADSTQGIQLGFVFSLTEDDSQSYAVANLVTGFWLRLPSGRWHQRCTTAAFRCKRFCSYSGTSTGFETASSGFPHIFKNRTKKLT